jgi:hypothetical protein
VTLLNYNYTFIMSDWWHVYLTVLAVHVIFSVMTVVRVFGMIYQYSRQHFPRECLRVTDGRLEQTPFTRDCLNGLDVVIMMCASIILLIVSLLILYALARNSSRIIGRKFNMTRFSVNGQYSNQRPSREKLYYAHGYYRIENHFERSHSEFNQWTSKINKPDS